MEDLEARRRRLEVAELDLKEDELALKRAKLAREMRDEEAKEASSTIVRLNVGGDPIDTTVETLTSQPSSFFDGLLRYRDDPALPGARRDRYAGSPSRFRRTPHRSRVSRAASAQARSSGS